jgi:uncharacterized protein (DUF1015 family)
LLKNKFSAVNLPEILLPNSNIDISNWSVIACDQYTSQKEYWQEVKNIVRDTPSALNIILPEVYLDEVNTEERIAQINATMENYTKDGTLSNIGDCFVLVDRKTSHVQSRKGLIAMVDLEEYDYSLGSQTIIRATEGTVVDRLPPRIKIRENAPIELPHIMILIDDPKKTVIEPLFDSVDLYKKIYDFDLMLNGGHISGYQISDQKSIAAIYNALSALSDPEIFKKKYSLKDEKGVLTFAVGDGNHSLATAKACWENIKNNLAPFEVKNNPARYALVEIVNIHDEGIIFEPIHRVVFNVNIQEFLSSLLEFYKGLGLSAFLAEDASNLDKHKGHIISYVTNNARGYLVIENPRSQLEVGSLQEALDYCLKGFTHSTIDYIHGDDVVQNLVSKPDSIGFFLPPMNKYKLFESVIKDGSLPRKTFSMGEAEEKRYYLECRKIK